MSETPQLQHEKTAVLLANAGLAPFLILTLLSLLHVATEFALHAFVAYSLAIYSFLGGTWWGFALLMQDSPSPTRTFNLVASNISVLVAIAVVVLLEPVVAVFVMAALFCVLVFLERRLPGLNQQPAYYRLMRLRVSMIAAGLHLLFGWAISAV